MDIRKPTIVLLAAIFFAVAAAFPTLAEETLTGKSAKRLIKNSERCLKAAEKASGRGEVDAVLAQTLCYTDWIDHVVRAFENNKTRERDVLAVAERVDEATLKHVGVLERLLSAVPETAQPAILHALTTSRRGHVEATFAILRRSETTAELSGDMLTERAARDVLERSSLLLRHAERAQKWGDDEVLRRTTEQYAENIGAVSRLIEAGAVSTPDAESVFDLVNTHTTHHLGILRELIGKVPAEARPAIERALEVSQRGNRAATEALARIPESERKGASRGGSRGGKPEGKPGGKPDGSPGRGPGGKPAPPR